MKGKYDPKGLLVLPKSGSHAPRSWCEVRISISLSSEGIIWGFMKALLSTFDLEIPEHSFKA